MQNEGFWTMLAVMISGLIGVASLALIVSRNSNTTGVVSAGFTGFTNALATAISPVTQSGSLSNFPIG
jgi:FtsH-binding integral membrane protein